MSNAEEIHKNILFQARDQAKNCGLMVLEHVEDGRLKEDYLKRLQSVLEACVKSEYDHNITKEAIRATKQLMQENESDAPITERFDEIYKSQMKNLQVSSNLQQQLSKDPDLNNFRTHLQQESQDDEEEDDDDDDLVATSTNINLIDPISKKIMTEPVRNKHCGHVYDRDSVVQMIAHTKRKGFRCPAMGCAHRQPIKESDLEDAMDVKREIIRQKNQ